MAGRDESDRDTAAAQEREPAAEARPGAVQPEQRDPAEAEFAAALNVERDPDGEEPSAGQWADRRVAAAQTQALVRSELPGSKSDAEQSAATGSENPEQNQTVARLEQPHGLGPAGGEVAPAVVECRVKPRQRAGAQVAEFLATAWQVQTAEAAVR